MSALEGRLAELTTGLAEVHGRLGGVANVIAPLPEDVRGLSERIESRLGARLEQLDEIANAVAALSSRDASAQPSASGLDEIRTALEALSARPSLAEDREGVVLAVRQVLGETVRSTVTEVAAQSEQRILAKVDESTSASDERVLARLVESMSASEERLLGRVDASASTSEARVLERVDQSVAATEQRLIDHVDAAVLALAEALLKRRPGGGRAEPLAPRRAAPTAPAAPAAPVVAEPVEQEPPAGEPPAEEPPDVVDEAPPAFAESDDPGIIEGTVETVSEEVQPPGHDLGADADVDGASDQTRRRRAWWRPGE
jgi:hypothetical protein